MAGQIWPQGSPKFYRQVKIPTLLLSGTEDRLVTLDEEMETHFVSHYVHVIRTDVNLNIKIWLQLTQWKKTKGDFSNLAIITQIGEGID